MNAINHHGEHDVLATAHEDHESVIALTRDLVAMAPSPTAYVGHTQV